MIEFYICSKGKKFQTNPATDEFEPQTCQKCREKNCVITPPDKEITCES